MSMYAYTMCVYVYIYIHTCVYIYICVFIYMLLPIYDIYVYSYRSTRISELEGLGSTIVEICLGFRGGVGMCRIQYLAFFWLALRTLTFWVSV